MKIPTVAEVRKITREKGAGDGYHAILLEILTKAVKDYNGCKTIVEIGVDRGEGAYSMLKAYPKAKYYGFDSWEGAWKSSHYYHEEMARKLLAGFDVTLTKIDSTKMETVPYADLIVIDGAHSFDGCLNDLKLVDKFLNPKGVILVHDMIYITVNRAVMYWYEKNKEEFEIAIFEHSNRWAIIWRKKANGG